MKKLIVALAVVAMVGGAYADIFANISVGFGIGASNTAEGGLVNDVIGNEIRLQVISGGGNGLDFVGGQLGFNDSTGEFVMQGNDVLIGEFSFFVSAVGAYHNEGWTLNDNIGGNGTAWLADSFIVASGVTEGAEIYSVSQVFANADYSDPKTVPQAISFADPVVMADAATTVTIIPEPATLGLMGVAGLGMFLARKKARR